MFDADLNRLIQLYVVGVFTSFTLSQTGMVRHWLKEKHKGDAAAKGWQRSIVINAIGAAATFLVLVIVTYTKFREGAWIVIVAMPIIVLTFLSIHKHYLAIMAQLRRGHRDAGRLRGEPRRPAGARPGSLHRRGARLPAFVPASGGARGLPGGRSRRPAGDPGPLASVRRRRPRPGAAPHTGGDVLAAMQAYLRAMPRQPNDFVTVIVPEEIRESLFGYLVRRRSLVRLKAGLLRQANVVVTDVPVVIEGSVPVGVDARALIPQRTVTLVFVSSVNDATIRAVNYARSIGAAETRAIYFDLDPDEAHRLEQQWFDRRLGIPLDIVEAPFRDLTGPMLDEVRRFTVRKDTVVNVVIPEFLVNKWRHYLLHNQNALFIKRLFLYEERAVLTSVPFIVEDPRDTRRAARSEVADGS